MTASINLPTSECSHENAKEATLGKPHDLELLAPAGDQIVDGLPVQVWQAPENAGADGAPAVTLDQLLSMTAGRLPVGWSLRPNKF